MMTVPERRKKGPGDFRLTLGKYSGKTLSEVASSDPAYVVWLFRKTTSRLVERMVSSYLVSLLRGEHRAHPTQQAEFRTAGNGQLFQFDDPGPVPVVNVTTPSSTDTHPETSHEVPRVLDCGGLRRLDEGQVKNTPRGTSSPLVWCETCRSHHVVPPWLDVADWIYTRLVS